MPAEPRFRVDEQFNTIVSFPTGFVFGKGTPSDQNKKAKKKIPRQQLYTVEKEYYLRTQKSRFPKSHRRLKKDAKVKRAKQPQPQLQPQPQIINLSDGCESWPCLQRHVLQPNNQFSFDLSPPSRPGWYKLLLPIFSYLSPFGSIMVPHSNYLNIRLYSLQKLQEHSLTDIGPNTYGPWLLAQALKVYLPMIRVRFQIQRLIQLWHIYKCNKRTEKLDPFTLTEAQSPISIYCMKIHKRYDYDPHSLIKYISSSLRYQLNGFATPQMPKLPQTNEPLTFLQLTSIFDQTRQKGIWSAVFGMFRASNFNIEHFTSLTAADLQQRAIKAENMLNDSYIVRENIELYFQKACELHRIYPTEQDYRILQYGIDEHIEHSYLQSWKAAITSYLSDLNIYPHSSEKKAQIQAQLNRKTTILLRLFYQFKKYMLPKLLTKLREDDDGGDGETDDDDNVNSEESEYHDE